MVVTSVFRCLSVISATVFLIPAWAQTAASTPAPTARSLTRMQHCQMEIEALQGSERQRTLRECLVQRTEGERIVTRNCTRQMRDLPAGTHVDKPALHKKCVETALQVRRAELPGYKAPAASATVAKPSVSMTTVQATASPVR
jgi:hypothetical protein